MLPGFNSSQPDPGSAFGQAPTYSSSPAAPSYPPRQASREASPQQDYPSSPSDNEEDSSFIAADDDSADEEAVAAAADDTCESTVEGPVEAAGYGGLSAQEEARPRTAFTGMADESAAAALEAEKAFKDSVSLSDEASRNQGQSPATESKTMAAVAVSKAPDAMTEVHEAMTKASKDGVQSAPGGGGILDEYLRRMHFSKESPLPAPVLAPTQASMMRQWTKTNSYPDGQSASLFCSSCSSPAQKTGTPYMF